VRTSGDGTRRAGGSTARLTCSQYAPFYTSRAPFSLRTARTSGDGTRRARGLSQLHQLVRYSYRRSGVCVSLSLSLSLSHPLKHWVQYSYRHSGVWGLDALSLSLLLLLLSHLFIASSLSRSLAPALAPSSHPLAHPSPCVRPPLNAARRPSHKQLRPAAEAACAKRTTHPLQERAKRERESEEKG
jgi:hypothetical protein